MNRRDRIDDGELLDSFFILSSLGTGGMLDIRQQSHRAHESWLRGVDVHQLLQMTILSVDLQVNIH